MRCGSSAWSSVLGAMRIRGSPTAPPRRRSSSGRGAPLADVASEPFAGPEIRRLEELYLRAIELGIDAELAAGRHGEVIGRLEALSPSIRSTSASTPSECLPSIAPGASRMHWRRTAKPTGTLTDEIGIEPGSELRRLQEQILARTPRSTRRRRPRSWRPSSKAARPLLAGRERELGWLRERWEETRSGGSTVALVSGPAGIGKTRLVAELARDVHRGGASVIYAAGSGAAEPALDAVRRAGESERPTLLVIDDADDAPPAALEAAVALAAKPRAPPLLILALHRDEPRPTGAGGLARAAGIASPGARAPGSRRGRGDRRPVRTRRRPRDPDRAPDRRERRGAARAAPRGQRVGSSAGEPATGGNGRQGGGRARRPARGAGGAGRERRRSSGGARTRRSVSGRAGRPIGARGLPVPGPGPVRCRALRVLLRARATGCRPRRARRRLDPVGGRGAFGQWQVLGASRRPAARAGERDAAGLGALAAGADEAGRASARGAAARSGPRRASCTCARRR